MTSNNEILDVLNNKYVSVKKCSGEIGNYYIVEDKEDGYKHHLNYLGQPLYNKIEYLHAIELGEFKSGIAYCMDEDGYESFITITGKQISCDNFGFVSCCSIGQNAYSVWVVITDKSVILVNIKDKLYTLKELKQSIDSGEVSVSILFDGQLNKVINKIKKRIRK